MRKNRLYRIENVQVGSFGFVENSVGLLLKNQTHPTKTKNHGLTKDMFGYYLKKSNGEIWKTNGKFHKATFIEIIIFYIELFKNKKL